MSGQSHAILIAVSIPSVGLLLGAAILISRQRTLPTLLQFLGAIGLLIVVLAHVGESFDLFSFMHWGLEQSAGHYLDLAGAILAATLFPVGYLLQALASRIEGAGTQSLNTQHSAASATASEEAGATPAAYPDASFDRRVSSAPERNR